MRTAVVAGVLAAMAALISSAAWAYSPRPLMRLIGPAAAGYFGSSVSTAGDVNGDGYADVIVGAESDDTAGSNAGRAFVYYGGPDADDVADLIMTGAASGDEFGKSVSGAGDVNGDGYDDVIVGAPGNSTVGNRAGRAYVYFGGAPANTVPDLTLTGAATQDEFGRSVSEAGDVNGDGYADVIVGAEQNDTGGFQAGRAYVFYGGASGDAVADLTLTGAAGEYFGSSVSEAGDVNGDGYADLIVGGVYSPAYVYHGGPSANAVADVILYGESDEGFGRSVSGAGDVNGDGYADVIVGASANDAGGFEAGRAYVYFGHPVPDAGADWILTGAAGDRLGHSVSGAGDVNGDGYADVIVGAWFLSAGGSDTGRMYVFHGGPGANTVADMVQTTASPDVGLGFSVSGAGDVNGDGYSDVIVGARDFLTQRGHALVLTSRPYELLEPNGGEQWISGEQQEVRWLGANLADLWFSMDGGVTYSLLASSVGGADQNEFLMTGRIAPTSDAKVRVSVAGEALTHSSSDVSDGVFSIVAAHDPPAAAHRLQRALSVDLSEDLFGNSVSDAGDVNGDGYPDVIVGAYANDAGGMDAGRAFVYFGGPASDGVADLVLTGEAAGDNFGISVSGAGDVNGDGYGDLIVGAWTNDTGGSGAGRAYVYHGGPFADASPDLILTGTQSFGHFGFSVSGAGDVNGDGYADVIVGAPFEDTTPDAGRAHVYFGGPVADAIADLTLLGDTWSNGNFGFSVSGAGDVNGDGYADVVVGAWIHSAGGTNAGRVFVYFGGPLANATADLTLTGAAANDNFGSSVSGAGDVNGDGFADIIVGSPLNDAGGPDAGRAYVYFGGPVMDAVAEMTMTGQAAVDQFGVSVSGAGDVNGDGFGDVIVGAYANDAGGTDAGRAYVYYGGPGADGVADHVLTGEREEDSFGRSVSGVGDQNGDGHADLIVGAYGNDPGGTLDAGAAYLYEFNRYIVTSPNGGETWNVGATKTLSWLGAEPAKVWLSVDGGQSYAALMPGAVGGSASNLITIQVPHSPTKFAKIQVTPADLDLGGSDRSDSLFTIQTSVALLAMLAAPLPEGAKGATISWQTDPGPEDLAGYRLERAGTASTDWRTVVALTRETSHTDPDGGPGSRYRLFAVNGLNEELWLGEAAIRPLTPLAAWPLPYRGGPLTVSFATAGGLGGGAGRAELAVYDVSGRLVRRIDSGVYPSGYRVATWDGRDGHGRDVAPGIYFVQAKGDLGYRRTMKISVLR